MAEPPTGKVQSIFIAATRNTAMKSVDAVVAEAGRGLIGDRYHGSKHRHVSVQSVEDLADAAAVFGAPIAADLTRRNISVTGFDIPTRPGEQIMISTAVLEVVRIAAPCKLLDDDIGAGAKTALRRRAGTIFRVLEGGLILLGDSVAAIETPISN